MPASILIRVVILISGLISGAILSGCSTVPAKPLGGDPHYTSLTFIRPIDTIDILSRDPIAHLPTDRRETEIAGRCAAGALAPAVVPGASLLASVVSQLINMGVEKIDKSLQDALKKYSTTYQGSTQIIAYSGDPRQLAMQYTCFRFSRGDKSPDGGVTVHFDLLGEVRVAPAKDRLQLRPLRLFVDQAEVPSATGAHTIAISLKSEAIWRSMNEGRDQVVFDKLILKEKVPFDHDHPTVKYYPMDDSGWIDLPIIPFSTPPTGDPYGQTKVTLSVAENGVPPVLLADMAKLFSGSKGSLEKLLAASADKTLGLPSTGSSGSGDGKSQ